MRLVLDKVGLVDIDTLFTALFVPCSVSAALLILILLVGIMVLSLEFIFLLLETSLKLVSAIFYQIFIFSSNDSPS